MVTGSVLSAISDFMRLPIPGGVFGLDGTILAANAAAEELLGRPERDLVGRKAWEIAPGAEHIWADVIAQARARGSFRGEIAIATPTQPRQIYYVVTLRTHEAREYVLLFSLEITAIDELLPR